MKSKFGLFTKTSPRPSTTMSLQPYDESGVRSAYGVREPSPSRVSSARSALETSTSRPSGRKSKHIGSDSCSTTTSVVPASSTATICPPVQSLNHSRPSCHRGDSTRPKPEVRISTPGSLGREASHGHRRRGRHGICGRMAPMQFGRSYEEFEVGTTYQHWPGKTVTEYDDHLFCLLTMNHHPLHLDRHYAEETTQFGQNVVVGNYVYSILLGMSVPDISGKAIANLEVESLRHVAPTFHGDTLYGQTTVLDKWESTSKD